MSAAFRLVAAGSILCLGLAACGGGGTEEEPVNIDYTALRVAESQDSPLVYARNAVRPQVVPELSGLVWHRAAARFLESRSSYRGSEELPALQ
jgi:hypothetical protein